MRRDDDGFTLEADPLLLGEADPFAAERSLEADSLPAEEHLLPEDREPPRPAIASPARAHFVIRAAAMAIDLAVLAAMDAVLLATASAAVLTAERALGHPIGDAAPLANALAAAGSLGLVIGYFVVLHAGAGQTLGKAALRIRVARCDGASLGPARSLLRVLGYLLSALPAGLGFLLALASSRRALHDRLAGSVVLRV